MAGGVCPLYVEGVPPSNVHNHEVGLFVDISVNVTLPPTKGVVVFEVKLAIGAKADFGLTLTTAQLFELKA